MQTMGVQSFRAQALPLLHMVILLVLTITPTGYAHPGGQDACGGHMQTDTGVYHVHNQDKMNACVENREASESMVRARYLPWLSDEVRDEGRDTSLGWLTDPTWATATVLQVVDGDTIEVELAGQRRTVRYIGIDTPETKDPNRGVGCYGKEAVAANRALVEGRDVYLELDEEPEDRFGRTLAYVYLPEGIFVNARLVELGYAQEFRYEPNIKHYVTFLMLHELARLQGLGMWGWCRP